MVAIPGSSVRTTYNTSSRCRSGKCRDLHPSSGHAQRNGRRYLLNLKCSGSQKSPMKLGKPVKGIRVINRKFLLHMLQTERGDAASCSTNWANRERFVDLLTDETPQPMTTLINATRYCPKCGKELVEKIARGGNQAGKHFWVCLINIRYSSEKTNNRKQRRPAGSRGTSSEDHRRFWGSARANLLRGIRRAPA